MPVYGHAWDRVRSWFRELLAWLTEPLGGDDPEPPDDQPTEE